MKKKILVCLFAFILCFSLVGCGKKKVDLNKIADKINNSETAKQYKEYGIDLKATANKGEIVISMKSETLEMDSTSSYKLDGTIFTIDASNEESVAGLALLINGIGQVHGYKDGELMQNLNSFPEKIKSYTLTKEGFELIEKDDKITVKIDASKKIPLIDMSEFYLTTDEFDIISDIIDNNSTGNQSGISGSIYFNVEVRDDNSYIYMSEEEKITQSSYKSILSAIEVIYGKDVVEEFKKAYPELKDGVVEVGAFKVENNFDVASEYEDEEDAKDSMFYGRKVLKVTVDNSKLSK